MQKYEWGKGNSLSLLPVSKYCNKDGEEFQYIWEMCDLAKSMQQFVCMQVMCNWSPDQNY